LWNGEDLRRFQKSLVWLKMGQVQGMSSRGCWETAGC
jgi:hypothetical protein